MQLALQSSGTDGGTIEVSDTAFAAKFNEPLVHQVVTAYMAGGRSGTRAQKNRAAVRGGGAKPWRQKGSGRARAGSSRSPVWRSGGRAFPAQPTSYIQKVNRKQYRAAMRSIVSELARQGRLLVVESFSVDAPKTRVAADKLRALGLEDVLVVVDELEMNLVLAVRNLPKVDVLTHTELDPMSLVGFEKVLITVPALKALEERLA